jgi:2',3'-cyclic-nucleotide 2'-phosphodiesterase (5'-nucleotidase family)
MTRMGHHTRGIVAAVFLTLGVAAPGTARAQDVVLKPAKPPAPGEPTKSLEVPPGEIVVPGKAPELSILYTGDVIGYLKDCGCKHNPAGGLSRRAWLLKQIDAAFPTVPKLLVDTGNFSDNPSEEGDIRTKGLLEGMGRLGYQVANVGERDLSLGYDDFVQRTAGSPIKFVSANVVRQDTKAAAFAPYTIVELKRGGGKKPLKVAVTGVMRYSPVWLKAGPDGTNLVIARPADQVRSLLPEMRKSADVVVLLAAMSKGDATQLANDVPGLDFVLGSYGGAYNYNEEVVGGARILYSGNQGKRIGETRVYLDAAGKVATTTSFMHFLTARYGDDPKMAAFVDQVSAQVNKVKGTLQAPPPPGQQGQTDVSRSGSQGGK